MTSLQQFRSNFIGLDRLFDDLASTTSSFPPYNICKTSDTDYVIEVAVAGYGKSELDIRSDKNCITVLGSKREDSANYVYKGISSKSFERKFTIADTVVITKAEYVDGLLKIYLFNDVQYKSSSKKIDIQ